MLKTIKYIQVKENFDNSELLCLYRIMHGVIISHIWGQGKETGIKLVRTQES